MAKVLVVEDDEGVGAPLRRALQANGHEVTWLRTGVSAVVEARTMQPDVVLLDLGLPDVDGVEVCRAVRLSCEPAVIVILTARGEEMDVVVGLEAGADDYLVKPVGLTELLARVRAHVRRMPAVDGPTSSPSRVVGALVVDVGARRVHLGDVEVRLRPKEFDLVARLAAEPGVVVTRERLISDVWDENWFGSTKTLDVHVAAVRRKLADAAGAARDDAPAITTVRGRGYRIDPVPASP
ncbi:response regulator transcription factor [Cellulomonas sp. ICMP 17802]|uniref:response regulator transcription factor n=1 Tax=Cellulomonas sp. ICMP 17802 TaxID=3239199 RepID=UPI00351AB682